MLRRSIPVLLAAALLAAPLTPALAAPAPSTPGGALWSFANLWLPFWGLVRALWAPGFVPQDFVDARAGAGQSAGHIHIDPNGARSAGSGQSAGHAHVDPDG